LQKRFGNWKRGFGKRRWRLAAGAREFGENRVQELLGKKIRMPKELKWHMIGHLQTNKVRQVVGEVELIHSLDRLDLAREIDRQAGLKKTGPVACLIQVNSSGETTKSGLAPAEVEGFADQIRGLKIQPRGLMTIGPLTPDEQPIRQAFRLTAELFKKLAAKFPGGEWNILSMGMSADYKIAIEEGSTLLRIGSAVFGSRKGTGS
jgi:pyridoxal phosphate enzyme (YggS family)